MKDKKQLTGMAIDFGMSEIPMNERIRIISDAGFDAVFTGWKAGSFVSEAAKTIRQNGLIYQSVHAPFNRANLLWEDGSAGDGVYSELCDCINDCSESGVGIVIVHVWIGFEPGTPTETGLRRFSELADFAEKRGVKLALENTEGENYLAYLAERLFSRPNVGFCIDTGHEMCYNESRDLIGKYGKNGKLFATHLNDNKGITGENITWLDDSHLLPFDGIADWNGIAKRLKKVGYNDILMAELTTKNKPERHTHDRYNGLDCEGYVRLAYERVSKFAEIFDTL